MSRFSLFYRSFFISLACWGIFTLCALLFFQIIQNALAAFNIAYIIIPLLSSLLYFQKKKTQGRKYEKELMIPFGILSTPVMVAPLLLSIENINSRGSMFGIGITLGFLFTFLMSLYFGEKNRMFDAEERSKKEEQERAEAECKQIEFQRQIAEEEAKKAIQKKKIKELKYRIRESRCYGINIIPFLETIAKESNPCLKEIDIFRDLLSNTYSSNNFVRSICEEMNTEAVSLGISDRVNYHSL